MMLKATCKRLRLPKAVGDNIRHISMNKVQRHAVPAIVTQPPSGGFFSWLLGDKPVVKVPPMYEPLQGVKVPSPLPDYVKPADTKITTLGNGLKVASENTAGPTATIGIYINSGSIYENLSNFGATHVLEKMAFKSTINRSHLRLVREVEAVGGNVIAFASREQMSYTGDAIKTYMPEMVELLVDNVRNPVFHTWEVKEQLAAVKAEISEVSKNPQTLLLEALHSAGYTGALGQPLLAPESALIKLTPDVLHDFITENYTAPRIVLAASGVDHEEFLSVAEPLLADMPSVPLTPSPTSEYVGGDWRGQADSPKTHVAVAFEVPGGWRNEKDAVTATVLQTLLGGGGSFSSGGPGKGMYSRLYLHVLNHYSDVESFTAFSAVYNDTGLFGIHAVSGSDFVPQLVNLATNEFMAVATPGEVTEIELQRAKNAAISHILMNLESRVVVTEDIGRQILTYGTRKPVIELIETVNSITLEDISDIAEKIIRTPLTMASWGDVVHVPRYDEVASRF